MFFPAYEDIRNRVLAQIVMALGEKLSDRYWKMWEERAEFFDDDGKWVGDPTWERQEFLNMPQDRMSGDELMLMEEVSRKMVRYEPKDRITAEEVVRLIPEGWLQEGRS